MEYVNIFAMARSLYTGTTTTIIPIGNTTFNRSAVKKSTGEIVGEVIGLVIVALLLASWIWNIVALFKFAKRMPESMYIFAVILAICGFNFFSLMVIYASKV